MSGWVDKIAGSSGPLGDATVREFGLEYEQFSTGNCCWGVPNLRISTL